MTTEKLTTKRVQSLIAAGVQGDTRDAAARGLTLRVRGGGIYSWTVRRSYQGRDHRLDLGQDWTLDEARELAYEADRRSRIVGEEPFTDWGRPKWEHHVDDKRRAKAGLPPTKRAPEPPPQPKPDSIVWQTALEDWYQELLRTRRDDTAYSYVMALRVAEMRRFEGRFVRDVTVQEAAEAVAAIHRRGKERQANTSATAMRGLFEFLGRDANNRRTGVEKDRMKDLAAPEDTLEEEHDPGNALLIPDGPMTGHLVRAFRDEALPLSERDRLAGLLCVYTVQRRRPVAIAKRSQFEAVPGLGGLWKMRPLHRKSASIKTRRGLNVGDHVVVLPPPVWAVVERASALAGDSEYLFPAVRKRREGLVATSLHPSGVTHAFAAVPGNPASPHDMRRAFGTTYANEAGLSDVDVKRVLDHNEGVASGDVTREHYRLTTGQHEKWPVMQGWVAWVNRWTATRE